MAKFFTRLTSIVFLVLLSSTMLFSQENRDFISSSLSVDFQRAKQLAFDGNREEARKICYQILEKNTAYFDARILIGRTFAWQKNFQQGRKELQQVLEDDFDNKDAIFAIIDLEKWAGDLSKALFYCDYGQSFFPNEEKFLVQKIQLLQQNGEESKALQTINELLDLKPASQAGRQLLQKYKAARRKYQIIYQHDFEHFTKPYIRRWHVSSFQLSRRNIWGSWFAKVNLGDLIKDGETFWSNNIAKQFELDAYPRISKSNYMYLNYGYSPDHLFPKHRAGAEFYQKLPASFEVSAGIRYLNFDTSSSRSNVYIYTGSIGKYYRNYWFLFRTYLSPKNNDISQSYWLLMRRYLSSSKHYIGIELGSGVSPDEPRGNVSNSNIYQYDSRKFKLAYQDQLFEKRLTYLLRLGFEREEYLVNVKRNVLTFSLKLSYQL
ncbi:YaiO family outer membrane beta-barrel protein [Ancylomarina longa]|uniref:YaiO family outer membrane beta-barrel protein n=1 Tax=Ancylomarina longa TaxID=2487017 RepID=A0A434B032_9BACT|nr:YaiO family outer membrane beta-barrel protein [Ancylomarina longa]RUT80115.1 YaiO family outer membrane beta-barrel protein [Ancylomarina longa]